MRAHFPPFCPIRDSCHLALLQCCPKFNLICVYRYYYDCHKIIFDIKTARLCGCRFLHFLSFPNRERPPCLRSHKCVSSHSESARRGAPRSQGIYIRPACNCSKRPRRKLRIPRRLDHSCPPLCQQIMSSAIYMQVWVCHTNDVANQNSGCSQALLYPSLPR